MSVTVERHRKKVLVLHRTHKHDTTWPLNNDRTFHPGARSESLV